MLRELERDGEPRGREERVRVGMPGFRACKGSEEGKSQAVVEGLFGPHRSSLCLHLGVERLLPASPCSGILSARARLAMGRSFSRPWSHDVLRVVCSKNVAEPTASPQGATPNAAAWHSGRTASGRAQSRTLRRPARGSVEPRISSVLREEVGPATPNLRAQRNQATPTGLRGER